MGSRSDSDDDLLVDIRGSGEDDIQLLDSRMSINLVDNRNQVDSVTGDDEDHCHGTGKTQSRNRRAKRQLSIACALCFTFMIAEIIGGYIANSLAIMTDAAHMLSDFASFLISLFAIWVASKPATQRMSFGYYRAEVLGALTSVLIIWILTGILVYLATLRIINRDFEINADVMLITSGIGVAINMALGIVLHQSGIGHNHSHGGGGGHGHGNNVDSHRNGVACSSSEAEIDRTKVFATEDTHLRSEEQHRRKAMNINVRAAFIHVLGDIIQSVGVLIAAYIIKFKPEWHIADPICTFLFSILVLFTTITVLRDALHVLMEGVPKNIAYDRLKSDLMSVKGVRMAHSLHIWSLTMDKSALAVHLAIDESAIPEEVLQLANRMLRQRYNIEHTTVQVELYRPIVMDDCSKCKDPAK